MATQPTVTYEPPPNELSYYEELFTAADTAKTGEINGRDAVTFLSRSNLPRDLLRNIWNMADQNPKTNSLDRRKFFTSVRLIQLFQNGQKAQGPNLACADANAVMRPPFFEQLTGVSIQPFAVNVAVPAPNPAVASVVPIPATASSPPPAVSAASVPVAGAPLSPGAPATGGVVADGGRPAGAMQQHRGSVTSQQGLISSPVSQQGHSMANINTAMPSTNIPTARALTQDPYLMLPGEQVRYESHFPQYEKDGFVYGKEAVDLFSKSGLAKEILRDIWNLVDNPVDNRLSKLEFAIAMHLIVCISKKNLPLPPVLPPTLQELKAKASNAPAPPLPTLRQKPTPERGQVSLPSPTENRQATLQMPSISVGQNTNSLQQASISDAFEGMQGQGQVQMQGNTMHKRTSSNESALTPPLNNTTGSGPGSGSGSSSLQELEKVRSVLQKLQAENISLKAQLGQCSDEEKQVRDEIGKTVNEIGTLSQELTSLRSQVVAAKASLIEASAELKSQLEKRDLLKTLISETANMKEALQAGVQTIYDAEEIAKVAKNNGGPSHAEAASTTAIPIANPFGDAGSVLTDAFADSSSYQHGVNQAQRSHSYHQETPSSYYEQPVPVPAPPQRTGPSEEALRRLEHLQMEAERAEQDARSADDHAKALTMQFEDLRSESERANNEAKEKQNAKPKKKKGLRRGTKDKNKQKKELEAAIQYASEKNDEVNRVHYDLRNAESNASKLFAEARQKRAEADALELQLTADDSAVHQTIPAPMSQEDFGAAARGLHNHNPYETNQTPYKGSNTPYANLMGQSDNTNVMGVGGYPGTPAVPGMFHSEPMGGVGNVGNTVNEGLMGGSVSSNPANYTESISLMGGSATNVADGISLAGSVSYAGAASTTSERVTHPNDATNSSFVNTAYPGDSSFTDMSNAGANYEAARHGNEMSNFGAPNSAFPGESSVAGISYASASVTGGQNSAFPADTSVAGISNAGISYASGVQNPAPLADSSVAGLSYASAPHSANESNVAGVNYEPVSVPAQGFTDASNNEPVVNAAGSVDAFIHNEVSAAGSVDAFSHNGQSHSLSAAGSVDAFSHNGPSHSVSAAGSVDAFSHNGPSHSISAAGSIDAFSHNGPSHSISAAGSVDTFSQNGPSHSISVAGSLDNFSQNGVINPVGNGGLNSTSQDNLASADSQSSAAGIMAPAPSADSAYSSIPTTGVSNADSKDSFASNVFDGIPSPDKNTMGDGINSVANGMASLSVAASTSHDTASFGGGMSQTAKYPSMGSTSFGAPSNSISDGIPSPTASNDEYVNPFAQNN